MLKWIWSLIGKLFVMAGALILSQMPLFMQYYTQQLAGRVAELRWQVEGFKLMATQSNKSLNQYVQKFMGSDDPDFKLQGNFMQETIIRHSDFSMSLEALQQATVWSKPLVFLQKIHWTIAKTTLVDFEPGINLNVEGFVFAIVGMCLGGSVFYVLNQFGSLFFGFFRRLAGAKGN